MARFQRALRARLLPHGLVILVLWPVVSVLSATKFLLEHPLMHGLPWRAAFVGMVAGASELRAELLAVGALTLTACLVLFAALAALVPDRHGLQRRARLPLLLAEPLVFLLAAYLGAALEYPAILLHPVVIGVRSLRVGTATLVLVATLAAGAGITGFRRAERRGALTMVLAALLLVVGWWRVALLPCRQPSNAGSHTYVLFGVDSLSQAEDVVRLRHFTEESGGSWYERPVTPGLLTNAVWCAILMNRPVHESGTFYISQSPDWSRSAYHLVREARAQGFTTFSYFSDQFTTYVGSEGGFDVDASGPKGWKQIATSRVKNASVLLALLLPRLPRIPGARTPANQSGTFSFDVGAEIRAALTAGANAPRSLVVGHLDYLHQARFPGYHDLSEEERARVRAAPIEGLRDLSLHWQYPKIPGDPLGLYQWKIRHVQRLVRDEIIRTRFLDPAKENRLILFSDHGARSGLSADNFGEARYSRVVLATFGIPPRDCRAPISLLDLGALLGFRDSSRPGPADPVVEYTNIVTRDEWTKLMKTATPRPGGEIDLGQAMLETLSARLRGYRPYPAAAAYRPTPATLSSPGQSAG